MTNGQIAYSRQLTGPKPHKDLWRLDNKLGNLHFTESRARSWNSPLLLTISFWILYS